MINKRSQPTQCPTGHKSTSSSASTLHSQQEGARARVTFPDHIDDSALAKAQGTSAPTKPVPTAFRYIASRRTCDPAGKRAIILRKLEAAEERKLQTAKKNKIPQKHD